MDNNENIRDDMSDDSDFHSIPPYVKTPSPPIPVRNVPTPANSESPLSYPRIGQLEDQRKAHAEARINQAAMNSVTSISSKRSVKKITNSDEMIRNGPGDDGPNDEDGFDDTESVLNAELVSEEEASARDIEVVAKNAIFDLFVLVPLMIIPSFIVYLLLDFPVYNIFKTKTAGINIMMEFIRYNVFATVAFGLFVVMDVFSLVLPEIVLMYTPVVKDNKATQIIRNQMHLLIKVRKYVTIAAWLTALLPISAMILYESMFLTPWDMFSTTLGATPIPQKQKDDLIQAEKYVLLQKNFEVGLLLLAIFSAILAVEKYFIQMVSLNFHRMAFAERISECNRRFGHLIKLYEAIKFGKPRVLSSHSMSLLDLDSSAELSTNTSVQLTSVHRAKSIARIIHRSLLPEQHGNTEERDYLIVDDFKKWSSRPKEMFDSFDVEERGEISYHELEEAVIDIYNTRNHLVRGLKSNGKIVNKLDSLFTIIALASGAAISTPIFDIGAGKLFVSISALSAGFGFMFHSTAKSCFESMLFVFIQHPFDVGDRVIIDDENFIVEDIEVFTTKMTRWDGVKVYISNSMLCSKVIQNIRRSEDQFESVGIKIRGETMSESLWTFRSELKKQLLAHQNNFTGVMDLINMEKLPSRDEPLSVTIVAQVRGNFQNSAKKNLRRGEFLEIVETSLKNSNINKA